MAADTLTFAVLYRWRLRAGLEDQFVDAWRDITLTLLGRGGRGSRLHRGPDGVWYAYAQWPSEEARARAFDAQLESDAMARMRDAIEERFDEVPLQIVADLLRG